MKPRVKRHAVVQPQDKSIRLIPLTQGQNAIVDAADYEWLSQWNWYTIKYPTMPTFYAVRSPSMKHGKRRGPISMQREILGLSFDDPRKADHINSRNTLDNRRSNLRIATNSQSAHNTRMHSNNKCGFKGVGWNSQKGKWQAKIMVNRKTRHLGFFVDPKDAYAAYCEAAKKHHGEFANLGH